MINRRLRVSGAKRHLLYASIALWLALALVGCGAHVTPVLEKATELPAMDDEVEQEKKVQPTIQPSATPLPPTETPVPAPTNTPTSAPTATPAPTETPMLSPIDRMVAVRNADNGAALFVTFQENAGSGYSCSNCHLVDSEKANLGPGLLNIRDRAATRVEGQSAAEYIYESIKEPAAYLVEDFDAELMPRNWSELYTDLEIFDIVAYLLTLEGRSDINDPDPAEAAQEESDEEG